MYERFTDRGRKVMQLANQEAQRLNHEYIGVEHILLGLLKLEEGIAIEVLQYLKVDFRKLKECLSGSFPPGRDLVSMGSLPQTPRAKKVIEYSMEEARSLNHNYVGTEHLLLGILREGESAVVGILKEYNVTLGDTRKAVMWCLGHHGPSVHEPSSAGFRKHDPWGSMRAKFKDGHAVHGVYNLQSGYLHVLLGKDELPESHPLFIQGHRCEVRGEANPHHMLIRLHGSDSYPEAYCYVPRHLVGFISPVPKEGT